MGKNKGQSIYKKTKQYKGSSSASGQKQKGRKAAFICRLIGIIIVFGAVLSVMPATLPRFAGYEAFHVETGSMAPAIPSGSVAYIKQKAPVEININDIVAFISGDTVVIHRVVENNIEERELTTKGDANPMEDAGKVSYDAVLGVVGAHIPGLGAYMAYCLGVPGRFILLALVVIGTILIFAAGQMESK